MTNIVFEEKQRFSHWWIWLLLIGTTLIPIYGLYQQVVLGIPFGNNPMSDWGLVLFLILMLAFDAFFFMMHLRTRIDETSIKFELYPLVKREIRWETVESAEIANYGYAGGWGIRSGTKYGTVYNARGNKGLALKLRNQKKLCLGTQKEGELKAFLERIDKF